MKDLATKKDVWLTGCVIMSMVAHIWWISGLCLVIAMLLAFSKE